MILNNPNAGEELTCHHETGNSHDYYAVTVNKGLAEMKDIRHVPREISAICTLLLLFIRIGGIIHCQVTVHKRYLSDLLQGGLETVAILIFVAFKNNEGKKAKHMIKDALKIKLTLSELHESLSLPYMITELSNKPMPTHDSETASDDIEALISLTQLDAEVGAGSPVVKKAAKISDIELIIERKTVV